jgi:RES domain-containing protein
MLSGQYLQETLQTLPISTFEGVAYRAVDLEALFGFHRSVPYQQPLPLFSEGARQRGARYTPRGGPASLYLALDPQTAYAEANRVHTRAWMNVQTGGAPALPPTVLISVQIRLQTVLDLTDTGIRKVLQTSTAELLRPWRLAMGRGIPVATQLLGQAVFDSGRYQALWYPSAQSTGAHCLVVFPERLAPPAYVETIDRHGNLPHRLP